MSNAPVIGFLVVLVLVLSGALAWMWADHQDNDVTIDLPEIHTKK